ncbi:putative CRM domain-containing protein, chloroplastic [Iris pallida]|nr:putative CRM domain-containing protein, chloroplastic [Iris pallida]
MQRKREKRKRKEANKSDPRRIRPKGRKIKQRFPTAEDRIKYKIEKAKMKEEMLVEKLKRYEVPKLQGPMPKPDNLTGEERFYMKKMAQKRSNYVPVGRRGVFGGVILNMHLHWKKHETVKVICKPCKPGQVREYARDIARLSGGIPIQIIGDDTIIFYRGKNYVQPEVMSPIDTLSKRKALEKSKYEQSLETVRRFIAISEKELELYYRHVALYGDPASRYSDLLSKGHGKATSELETGTSDSKETGYSNDDISAEPSDADSDDCILSGSEHYSNKDEEQEDEDNPDYELLGGEADSESEELSEVDSKDYN